MDAIIIKNIPFNIKANQLYPILKIKPDSRFADRLDIGLDRVLSILVDGEVKKAVSLTADNLFTFDNALVMEGRAVGAGKHVVELRRTGRGPLSPSCWGAWYSPLWSGRFPPWPRCTRVRPRPKPSSWMGASSSIWPSRHGTRT